MKKLVVLAAVAAAALVSCTKAETPVANTEPQEVHFSVANLGTYEFKSPTLALGADGCSTVGIYASDLGADNVQATVSGSALTPASTIYWNVGQVASSTFIARYPYYAGATTSDAYTITANQTNVDDYSYHANFMSAVQTASPDPGTVAFDFKHPFSKIVINVTNNLEADVVASVVVKQMKMSATTLNLATAPATATLSETLTDVTAYAASATEFDLIVMPQAATSAMDIVVTTTLGSVYTFRITGEYTFQAGKVATAAVTLDPIDGAGGGRSSVGALSFSTTEWAAGAATTVGTIGTPTLGNYFQVGGCVYATADKNSVAAWEKYYNMVYTGTNSWTFTINYDESMTDDPTGKGFIIRCGENYYGMYTGSDNVTDNYELYRTDNDHKNAKFASAGNYTVTGTYDNVNDRFRIVTITRNGDAE